MKTIRPGIRKKKDGQYIVTKSIKGKRFYKECRTLSQAIDWKNQYSPLVNPSPKSRFETTLPAPSQSNGKDLSISFGDVWKKYKENKLKTFASVTQYKREQKLMNFASSMLSVRMCELTPNVVDTLLDEQKLLIKRATMRCNFNEELKILRVVINWYAENYDSSYNNPIRSFHKNRGKVKEVAIKDLNILPHELHLFFSCLPRFWQRLAYMQLYMAGRIQEVAGLKRPYVSMEQRLIKVAEVLTWVKSEPEVKRSTKTGKDSLVHINDHMAEILLELENERPDGCEFMFQIDGAPLRYAWIIKAYNDALKVANLPYTGTHIMRYGAAGIAGDFGGDEAAMAATRHATLKMAQKYRGKPKTLLLNPENKAVVIHAESIFYKKKDEVRATSCDLGDFVSG